MLSHAAVENLDMRVDRDEIRKGFVSSEVFITLCRKGGQEAKAESIKTYLLALGVAVKTKDGGIFIPALVSHEHKVTFKFIPIQICVHIV